MIVAALGENEKQFTLVMTGHASYAEPGKDIVCSAASVLVYTLIENIGPEKLQGCVKEGNVALQCICAEDSSERVVLNVIAKGLRLLAQQNPEYMCMTEFRLMNTVR